MPSQPAFPFLSNQLGYTMTEQELQARSLHLKVLIESYHAARYVYLVEFPGWQDPCGNPLSYAVVASRHSGRVLSGQKWMNGKPIQDVKEWVWSCRGIISCNNDPDLCDEDHETGKAQRLPIKRITFRVAAVPAS